MVPNGPIKNFGVAKKVPVKVGIKLGLLRVPLSLAETNPHNSKSIQTQLNKE